MHTLLIGLSSNVTLALQEYCYCAVDVEMWSCVDRITNEHKNGPRNIINYQTTILGFY